MADFNESHYVSRNPATFDHVNPFTARNFVHAHNKVNFHRDITALQLALVSNLCRAVDTEPCLQRARGEQLAHRAANREESVYTLPICLHK